MAYLVIGCLLASNAALWFCFSRKVRRLTFDLNAIIEAERKNQEKQRLMLEHILAQQEYMQQIHELPCHRQQRLIQLKEQAE